MKKMDEYHIKPYMSLLYNILGNDKDWKTHDCKD